MRIIFMRHAKAEGAQFGGDVSRALTPRGQHDAAAAGQALAKLGVDHAFVSSAARTRETFEHLGLDIPVTYLDELYNASPDALIPILSEVTDVNPACVLIVGHVPSVQVAAWECAQLAGEEQAMERLSQQFPTSSFAAFDVAGDFQSLEEPLRDVSLVQLHWR